MNRSSIVIMVRAFVRPVVVALLAAGAVTARTPGDNSYFAAITAARHERSGTIDFGAGREEMTAPAALISFGFEAGRNFRLSEALRFSLPVTVSYGFARDAEIDHLYLDNGSEPPANLNTLLFEAGFLPQLQVPLRLSERVWAIGIVGAGVHYCASHEEEWTQDSLHLLVADPYLEKGTIVTWSVTAGAGLERSLSRGRSFFIHYRFRFWYPIDRKTARDNLFPLESLPYREQFLSHSVSIGYMVPRLF